ncbi:uncharacterized protein N7483_005874 [Penicillium malachiteum]|uniref:uncharacterized protein n=1 Tax=Penicillium malachiteum TaxID=1324776 RepID=UPI00254819C9|nr:uncharacterized protein N7483_005874 [Penicillium malachiteum]KAJ5731366.1 hypothetical protein N7483_005874 [Penicillium malachiteum]
MWRQLYSKNLGLNPTIKDLSYWPSETHNAMRNAIEAAGFGYSDLHKFKLRSEPKVAAQYVISNKLEDIISLQFSVGDRVLLCDCGGGTVVASAVEQPLTADFVIIFAIVHKENPGSFHLVLALKCVHS